MAKWQIVKNDTTQVEIFDDKTGLENGDEGFSATLVREYCATKGANFGFNYISPTD